MEVRRFIVYDDSSLATWLWFKETEDGRAVAQTITHIVIYDAVTRIQDGTFADLSNLTTVVFESETPPELGDLVFKNTQHIDFFVPDDNDIINDYQNKLHEQLGHTNFSVDGRQHTSLPEGEDISLSGEAVSWPEENNRQSAMGHQCAGSHTWTYKEYIVATTTEDTIVIPVCEDCGIMGSLTKLPGSAHIKFLQDTAQQITDAKKNATVTVASELWFSTNHLITDALTSRKDVSLTINYKYAGKYYTVTIPAGYNVSGFLGENGWTGFRYFAYVFHGKELTAEEWKCFLNK